MDSKKVKRPPNAYILFSKDFRKTLKGSEIPFPSISMVVSQTWKNLPQEVKDEYSKKADEIAKQHLKDNPGYKYTPTRKKKVKVNKFQNKIQKKSLKKKKNSEFEEFKKKLINEIKS